jgi:hypothetical protein
MHRDEMPKRLSALAVALAALAALAVAAGVIPTPDVGSLLARATISIGAWMYLVVAALAFLETAAFVGLLVPGEIAIVVGGVAAANGKVDLVAMTAVVWVAAVGAISSASGSGAAADARSSKRMAHACASAPSTSSAPRASSPATAGGQCSSGVLSGCCAR